jgi:hypothetical protein
MFSGKTGAEITTLLLVENGAKGEGYGAETVASVFRRFFGQYLQKRAIFVTDLLGVRRTLAPWEACFEPGFSV